MYVVHEISEDIVLLLLFPTKEGSVRNENVIDRKSRFAPVNRNELILHVGK